MVRLRRRGPAGRMTISVREKKGQARKGGWVIYGCMVGKERRKEGNQQRTRPSAMVQTGRPVYVARATKRLDGVSELLAVGGHLTA